MQHRASKIADAVADSASNAVSDAKDIAADTADSLRSMGENWLDALSNRIVERPLTSAGIALAVGFVLSRVIGRRR